MRVEIQIQWDDEAKVWMASSSGDFGLAIESASLKALKERIPEVAADLADLPVGNLEIIMVEAKHPAGYQYDSEQDWLQWEDTKRFLDDGWHGPKGDLSKTDLNIVTAKKR
ncbi:DUF1902 domain-containing protein [Mesorhizobium sp. 8]|uniref:DUF1902 domain-containing protein n=1 Tax=Mesorhizobium sp. 8 TaxID=2584466 RepID=UPI0015D661DF|nr:DUF1902 domain-containing protein [Mesorhizobium sp. 8]